jgi:hypothetical protein
MQHPRLAGVHRPGCFDASLLLLVLVVFAPGGFGDLPSLRSVPGVPAAREAARERRRCSGFIVLRASLAAVFPPKPSDSAARASISPPMNDSDACSGVLSPRRLRTPR